MSLFSFLRKNKQESTSGDSQFYSRAEEESKAFRGRGKRGQGKAGAADSGSRDPVLPEKKRARRRLIGVVALVLAAVIGLPMVLDSEPKPLADDIAIQIPSKDKTSSSNGRNAKPSAPPVAASAALDPKEEVFEPGTDAPAAVTPAAPAPVVTEPKASPKVAIAPQEASAAPPAKSAKTADASKANNGDSANKASAEKRANSAQVIPKADSKAEAKPAENAADAARAKALLDGKSDPAKNAEKNAEKKSGKFVIQVAALATKEKVDELQSKLKGAGISSYTQKVATGTGDRTRIRIGPFTSKEEAERVRAKIAKLGLNGTLVPA